jgi:hypothetical protein
MRGPETVAAGPPSPEELIRRRDELMAKQRERDRLRREEEERQRAHTVKVGARRPGRW